MLLIATAQDRGANVDGLLGREQQRTVSSTARRAHARILLAADERHIGTER